MGIFDKIDSMDKNHKINKKINNFFDNEDYIHRLILRFSHDSVNLEKIKEIIKMEMINDDFEKFNINNRFMELIKMDVDSLYGLHLKNIDTSKFKSQIDLDNYFGKDYAENYKNDFEELVNNTERSNLKSVNTLPKYNSNKNKNEPIKFGSKIKRSSNKINKSSEKLEKILYEDSSEELGNISTDNYDVSNIVIEKKQVFISQADIEIFKKVKSNTAIASAALFLVSGSFIAEAKEEMKYVKTRLKVKNDGIEIKNPSSFHKFNEFRGFQVDRENDYDLFYIVFSDEEMIHFRTKNKLLYDAICEKFRLNGIPYERAD